jgi:hypothetical protein
VPAPERLGSHRVAEREAPTFSLRWSKVDYVRLWHLADIDANTQDVRFQGVNWTFPNPPVVMSDTGVRLGQLFPRTRRKCRGAKKLQYCNLIVYV